MAIVLLAARRHPTTGPAQRYLWRVHLDDSRVVPDPAFAAADPEAKPPLVPDPDWVREWEFPGAAPEKGMKVAEYVESQRREVKLLAELELERMGGRGRRLPGEGEEL